MIIGVFENNELPARGGGFSYKKMMYEKLDTSGHCVKYFSRRRFQNIINFILIKFPFLYKYYRIFNSRFKEVDILIFFEPKDFVVCNVPHIYVCWDLAHFYSNSFPEIIEFRNWAFTTLFKKIAIQRAFAVIVGTSLGKKQTIDLCSVEDKKVFIVPFPARKLESFSNVKIPSNRKILFYPASFWPHKNHIFLLDFVRKYKSDKLSNYHFVFCGADKGNLGFLKRVAEENSISSYFTFKEFVEESELAFLYKISHACVFPTLIGPDNLPPLEAMLLNCPVLASDIPGAREQFLDTVSYFDPFDVDTLHESLIRLGDKNFRSTTITNGYQLAMLRNESLYWKQFCSVIQHAQNHIRICDYKKFKPKFR